MTWMCRRCGEEYLYMSVDTHMRLFHPEALEPTAKDAMPLKVELWPMEETP